MNNINDYCQSLGQTKPKPIVDFVFLLKQEQEQQQEQKASPD